MRLLSCVLGCALAGTAAGGDDPKAWATVKGQVVYPADKPVPKRAALPAPAACPNCPPILDEAVVVNPKNRGVKNVVVWLRPDDATDPKAKFAPGQIHPGDAKRKPAEAVIDQPCCMFEPRVLAARAGDALVVKNPAAVAHNFFWVSANNGEHNVNVPLNGQWKLPNPLAAEPSPVHYKCTIHPWMAGYVRVFDHPYYAVTDDDGKFEIKDAPAGKFRIVYWHESGVRGGAKGRFGEPIQIAGPTLEMKPVDFEVK
jgi:plastocyanin